MRGSSGGCSPQMFTVTTRMVCMAPQFATKQWARETCGAGAVRVDASTGERAAAEHVLSVENPGGGEQTCGGGDLEEGHLSDVERAVGHHTDGDELPEQVHAHRH